MVISSWTVVGWLPSWVYFTCSSLVDGPIFYILNSTFLPCLPRMSVSVILPHPSLWSIRSSRLCVSSADHLNPVFLITTPTGSELHSLVKLHTVAPSAGCNTGNIHIYNFQKIHPRLCYRLLHRMFSSFYAWPWMIFSRYLQSPTFMTVVLINS